MRGLKSNPWALIAFAALLGSCLAADGQDDVVQAKATDNEILRRLKIRTLSEIRLSTRRFPLTTRCEIFEDRLRKILGDKAEDDVVELFAQVVDALSRTLGKDSPVLKTLKECLDSTRSGREIADSTSSSSSASSASVQSSLLELEIAKAIKSIEQLELELANRRVALEALKSSQRQPTSISSSSPNFPGFKEVKQQYEQALDDVVHEQAKATDDEILSRLDFSVLSELSLRRTFWGSLPTGCSLLEGRLREMLGDKAEDDVVELYAQVVDALSRKKLQFGNVSPVLKALNECLDSARSGREIADSTGSNSSASSAPAHSSLHELELAEVRGIIKQLELKQPNTRVQLEALKLSQHQPISSSSSPSLASTSGGNTIANDLERTEHEVLNRQYQQARSREGAARRENAGLKARLTRYRSKKDNKN